MPNPHLLTQTFSQARHASGTHQFNGLEPPLTVPLKCLRYLSMVRFNVLMESVGGAQQIGGILHEVTDVALSFDQERVVIDSSDKFSFLFCLKIEGMVSLCHRKSSHSLFRTSRNSTLISPAAFGTRGNKMHQNW